MDGWTVLGLGCVAEFRRQAVLWEDRTSRLPALPCAELDEGRGPTPSTDGGHSLLLPSGQKLTCDSDFRGAR